MTKDEFETLLIRGGDDVDASTGALATPIYQNVTYKQFELGVEQKFDYSRSANPTRSVLERRFAMLEEGEYGFAFSSGMAAITALMFLFASGDEMLFPRDLYGGTLRLLDSHFKDFGIKRRMTDTTDISSLKKSFSHDTKALFLETPTNPTLRVSDIAEVCRVAHGHGALVIADNTFLTPYLQRPLSLGVDIVVHSATKYIAGHNDVLAGLIAVRDGELADRIRNIQKATGGVLAPFDSYLILRGLKTLAVRLDREMESALAVARWLEVRPEVDRVYYPGLESDAGYAINSKQASGAGGLLSFDLNEKYSLEKFVSSLKIFTLAESLGSVESMACHPATMSHASVPPEIRAEMGISDRLMRLAIGLEGLPSLLNDLDQAFKAALMPG
ncbi:MAG: PLP-dependent aspartate aminotransferase family protein [Synergistaceae bacterium]|jgi:cystathionine beta-lyase/cystathionine gamma-synthase|nr:PLP-dependent aspartate aminotransferase family protein [Synergistaceae bacterium]